MQTGNSSGIWFIIHVLKVCVNFAASRVFVRRRWHLRGIYFFI